MSKWIKKNVSKEVIKELHQRYGCDILSASIFARRGITQGQDIMYFIEDDIRYLHNPFLFNTMEDAVDRILQAKDEGEKVLIFGDRDVDGITSTTLLYQYLSSLGLDVAWRLPEENDSYGLSIAAVENFAAQYGSLIITVDCGISNNEEIKKAAESGIDVIVVDHHNVTGDLPEPAIIINPKVKNCGYPFKDISGCAVAYKLVSALRFAESQLYKQEICLLNVRPVNDAFIIEGIKTVNLNEKDRISETIIPGMLSISQTRLLPFLQGQQIFVWDAPLQQKQLTKIFGKAVEFNILDIRPEISQLLPATKDMSLLRLSLKSKITRYQDKPADELDAFFNLFVTYAGKQTVNTSNKADAQNKTEQNSLDLQLVAIAAIADIMPLRNENRILVRQGLASIHSGKIRQGLMELFVRLNLIAKKPGSTDLSWNLIPVLNAAGRLGKPELAVQLFTSPNADERGSLADSLIALNTERKQLGSDSWLIAEKQAWNSLERFNKKLSLAADEKIHRGVTGILASRLAKNLKAPAFVISFLDNGIAVGSVRSNGDYDVTSLLESCKDFFINYGGHNFAAGFSFTKDKYADFLDRLEKLSEFIELDDEAAKEEILIDAELPHEYIKPELLALVDRFEPYGETNPPLLFSAQNLKILQADIMGKTERLHLKLSLDCGKNKWPAIFWGESERLNRDFSVGDRIDAVFQITKNIFNGNVSPQMILTDCKKST